MKKVLIYILLALLALILIPIAFLGLRILFDSSNPLRKSSVEIRESILELTPIGTNMEEVVKLVRNNENWKISYIDYERGIPQGELGRVGDSIGKKSIRVTVGIYKNLQDGCSCFLGF